MTKDKLSKIIGKWADDTELPLTLPSWEQIEDLADRILKEFNVKRILKVYDECLTLLCVPYKNGVAEIKLEDAGKVISHLKDIIKELKGD
ncbi:hypothetical protein DRZ78_01765 [Candidatus Aerophobetes bacterium]|uniref:Uncharacterized protein n=1 Tax=Aerophobetes bacterium TaxID=2030807 RepID=A0A662D0V9_UNCAE|nr:MAG: hypothetical protein DRZ78_01765 [Candidatus Aerophobetes bacterium]